MVGVVVSPEAHGTSPPVIDVRMLGRFVVSGGGRSIRSWPRPSARRLCQLVLVSPGRKVSRESAYQSLFPSLPPDAAARSLYRVLSLARQALKELGPQATGLLCADVSQIWADSAVALAVDLDAHEDALHAALKASPGQGRDAALVEVLTTGGVPLEDEPEADWAARARERIEYLRQEARLELARDDEGVLVDDLTDGRIGDSRRGRLSNGTGPRPVVTSTTWKRSAGLGKRPKLSPEEDTVMAKNEDTVEADFAKFRKVVKSSRNPALRKRYPLRKQYRRRSVSKSSL